MKRKIKIRVRATFPGSLEQWRDSLTHMHTHIEPNRLSNDNLEVILGPCVRSKIAKMKSSPPHPHITINLEINHTPPSYNPRRRSGIGWTPQFQVPSAAAVKAYSDHCNTLQNAKTTVPSGLVSPLSPATPQEPNIMQQATPNAPLHPLNNSHNNQHHQHIHPAATYRLSGHMTTHHHAIIRLGGAPPSPCSSERPFSSASSSLSESSSSHRSHEDDSSVVTGKPNRVFHSHEGRGLLE